MKLQNDTIQVSLILQRLDTCKCCFCGKDRGKIPIVDKETLREVFICEDCEESLNSFNDYPYEQEIYDEEKRKGL